MSSTTTQTLADTGLAMLKRALDSPRVLRNVQKQLQLMPHAILPLLSLGSERDTYALWNFASALDNRLAGIPFDADDPEDVRRLEAALDSVSWEIIGLLLQPAHHLVPELSLSRGLLDGEWAIYAVIPREATLPTLKHLSLW